MSLWGLEPDKKSPEELALDAAMAAYYEHFGEHYGFQIGWSSQTTEEATEEIYRLIAEDRKQALMPYRKGILY